MRLINVRSLDIEEFHGSNIPEYAILSHTWGTDDASFREWSSRLTRWRKRTKSGFSKVFATCKQARRDNLGYAWVDTVCTDKSSLAELSEAINAMYSWYEKAAVCYVYLADVSTRPEENIDMLDLVRRSRWFTRGWTLQELLAPANVVLYTKEWTVIGTKNALAALISRVTGIEEVCLQKKKLVDEPPLYGEGSRAFRRLQEEIVKVSDDHSILAFDTDLCELQLYAPCAICHANAGLSMRTPLIQTLSRHLVLAALNCVEVDVEDHFSRSQILLPFFGEENNFVRAWALVPLIRKKLDDPYPSVVNQRADLTIRSETSSYLISHLPRAYWIDEHDLCDGMGNYRLAYGSCFDVYTGISFAIPNSRPRRRTATEPVFRGAVTFVDDTVQPERRVTVYLAVEDQPRESWTCEFLPEVTVFSGSDTMSTVDRQLEVADRCGLHLHLFFGVRTQYGPSQNAWVSARTQFGIANGWPCREAVLVEIVFDVDAHLEDRHSELRFMDLWNFKQMGQIV
ncbi:hypothetical protein VTK56DRAFT_1189 [Thermocarpiscus australiensis]